MNTLNKTIDQMNLVIVIDGIEVFYCDTRKEAIAYLTENYDDDVYAEVYKMGSNECIGSGHVGDI